LTQNLKKLDVVTLKRYRKYHRMKLDVAGNKADLVEAVSMHFSQQKVDEIAAIRDFLAHVKNDHEIKRDRESRRRNTRVYRS